MKKIGDSHSLITHSMERSLMIQNIRQKFNVELPTSFISIGLFIDVPFSAFGYRVWTKKRQDKKWKKHIEEYVVHTQQGPNCMIESRGWVTSGLQWYRTASIIQRGVSLANVIPILFINSQNHSIQLWHLGHLRDGDLNGTYHSTVFYWPFIYPGSNILLFK